MGARPEAVELKRQLHTGATILVGDCLEILAGCPDDSIDLFVTSPPYADARKKDYGGVPPDEYAQWFLPISEQMLRTLKPSGSFILNIKEKVVDGERSPYVMELVLFMRKQGWKLIEQYIWHKPNPTPGHWPRHLKDGWEHCFHFAKTLDIKFRHDAVKQPAKHMPKSSKKGRVNKATGSGFGFDYGRHAEQMAENPMVLPSNVITASVHKVSDYHPAVFPPTIPEFFIKLLTDEGDLVCDPFIGSGTTAEVGIALNRKVLGMEIQPKYALPLRKKYQP